MGSRYFSLLISFYYFDLSRLEEASVSMSRPLGTVRHVLRLDVISIVRPPNELERFFLCSKRSKLQEIEYSHIHSRYKYKIRIYVAWNNLKIYSRK